VPRKIAAALQVMPNGAKAWRFRYRFESREKMLSLGRYLAVPLEAARRLRDEARDILERGTDPSAERRARKHHETETFSTMPARSTRHFDAWAIVMKR
jgi:hypothetical protein